MLTSAAGVPWIVGRGSSVACLRVLLYFSKLSLENETLGALEWLPVALLISPLTPWESSCSEHRKGTFLKEYEEPLL